MDEDLASLHQTISAADTLLIELAGLAYHQHDTLARQQVGEHVHDHHLTGADIVGTVTQTAALWRHRNPPEQATAAICDAALAVLVHHTCPRSAHVLAAPWTTARRLRVQLHQLGAGAEHVARRILRDWSAPLEQLPAIAAAIAH